MFSRLNLSLVAACVAASLCSVVQPVQGQDSVSPPLSSSETDDLDQNEPGDKKNKPKTTTGTRRTQVTADGISLPNSDENYSLGLTTPVEQTTAKPVQTVSAASAEHVVVTGALDEVIPYYPALPEVQGTKINSGKKTSFVRPEEFPSVANNDYRELTATTPGIIVSEEPTSPIVNFGYRGLDSQRSEFSQVLKDGISIKNEQFGFPETHYTPILDAVERLEFIRGGAALMYGCQPGGAFNFVMKMPRKDSPFHFTTKTLFGSDELFTNFTSAEGTIGQFGYYGYYDHRERDGFRDTNGDYEVNNGSLRLVWDLSTDSRFILTYDGYEEEHGEPGGLRRPGDPADPPMLSTGQIVRYYDDDRNATTRLFDRFRLSRHFGELEFQKVFSERTQLDIKAFGGYLLRWSKRQRGGGIGIQPNPDPAEGSTADTNDIQARYAWSEGGDARLRHDYDFLGDVSTFAGGVFIYHALQQRDDRRPTPPAPTEPDAEDGLLRRFNYGETTNGSIFAENRFHFGRLSITPGMRLEFFDQKLDEEVNITRSDIPLQHKRDFLFAPLFGIGTSFVLVEGEDIMSQTPVAGSKGADGKDFKSVAATPTVIGKHPPRVELYGNFSQAYRPPTYGELVPLAANGVINGDLEEGHSLQGEIGVRGKPFSFLTFEMSGFWYNFTDQIGEVEITNPSPPPATLIETQNVGDSEYWGFEAAAELDVLALFNHGEESPCGRLNLYGNVTVLDAEFIKGPNEGNIPAYAPDYLFKTGVLYRWRDRVKAGFIGTIVDDHFANAGNTYQFFVPGYQVWDLTAEARFWEGRIGVFAGIKNLFDEDYWAEVRDEGILPAYRRNYYGGVAIYW